MMPRASSPTLKRKLPPPIREPKAATRPDWEWIRAEWEADVKTDRAIAAQSTAAGRKVSHNAIGQRARKEGWKKHPLTDQVKAQVAARLAAAAIPTLPTDASQPATDAATIIDAAARQGVEVIRQHRAVIGRSMNAASKLLERLEDAIGSTSELAKAIEEDTRPDAEGGQKALEEQAKRRERLMRTIGLSEQVTVLKDAAQAMRTLIGLERQAFNLNDQATQPDSIEERLKNLPD